MQNRWMDAALIALGTVAGSAWAGAAGGPPLLPWDHLLVGTVSGACGGISSTLGALHAEGSRTDPRSPAQARRALVVRVLYDLVTGAVVGAVVTSASVRFGISVLEMVGLSIIGGLGGGRIAERLILGVLAVLDRMFPAKPPPTA
jgi:uncharacterized membrane protein